jgi:hypothetical protein
MIEVPSTQQRRTAPQRFPLAPATHIAAAWKGQILRLWSPCAFERRGAARSRVESSCGSSQGADLLAVTVPQWSPDDAPRYGSRCPKRTRSRCASHCSVPHASHTSHFSYFLLTSPGIWFAKPPRPFWGKGYPRGSALGGSWLLHSFCYWRRAPRGDSFARPQEPHTALLRASGMGLQRGRLTLIPTALQVRKERTACGLVRVLQACDPGIATRRAKKT